MVNYGDFWLITEAGLHMANPASLGLVEQGKRKGKPLHTLPIAVWAPESTFFRPPTHPSLRSILCENCVVSICGVPIQYCDVQ